MADPLTPRAAIEAMAPYSPPSAGRAGKLRLDFKWADNIPNGGDILDFLDHGDVAPNGRFNYRYEE